MMLEDGRVFNGKAAGRIGTATGEVCFNTGMTGYQEIFTDPSYFGQILTATVAHIGNYGTSPNEIESSSVKIAGLICKKFSSDFSRPSADKSLNDYFAAEGIVAVCDIDTRALVRHIRNKGAMNAIISTDEFDEKILAEKLGAVPSMEGLELVSRVSAKKPYSAGEAGAEFRVSLLDLGTKKNIIRSLVERNCQVMVHPYDTNLEDILSYSPDGILVSNGPGDPAPLKGVISTVSSLLETGIPMFGICLGHQVMALSKGLKTSKMHNGHRGINHPVKNLVLGHCEVTSQNHGFVVDMAEAEKHKDIEVTHIHLNDHTLAGMRIKGKPAFSVQYHPEASPGPWDSRYLFDQFISLMKEFKSRKHELHKQYQREANS